MSGGAHGDSEHKMTGWVRPWFRGEVGDHIFADCPEIEDEPVEGVGWLDPRGGDVCEQCFMRHDPELYEQVMGDDD